MLQKQYGRSEISPQIPASENQARVTTLEPQNPVQDTRPSASSRSKTHHEHAKTQAFARSLSPGEPERKS
jgi:hypothetical protein